jgi:hypothetical protein
VDIRVECSWTKSTVKARCATYDVPEGKRLVVETMRVEPFLNPSAAVFANFSDTETGAAAEPVRLRQQMGRYILHNRPVVAEGGTKLNIDYRPAEELRQIPASGTATIRLYGYLEPAL